jgi:regulatory protein
MAATPSVDGPTPGSSADAVGSADPVETARSICLQQLTGAPRTRAQLEKALARKNVPEPVARQVLDRFVEVGLVDDAGYAMAWVESRHRGRGLARRALAHELRQRGVGEVEAAQALDTLDSAQELATARALVDRRVAATRGMDPERRVRRLAGMLARKGYGPGLSMQVVRAALADDDDVRVLDGLLDGLPDEGSLPEE